MLPECRTKGDVFSIPQFSVVTEDIKDFIQELEVFHKEFKDCFSRSEPRNNFFQYMVGQLSELERKSIEPIALSVENGKVRSMQRFISDGGWDEDKMLTIYRSMVREDMGDPNGVVIFDESGFVKKGDDSAGVARQYCGNVGKVENCQVGVFAAYASPYGYCMVDNELFIPEKWFTDEYTERRKTCNFPDDTKFKTKPQLAADMFEEIVKEDVLPFTFVVADTIYGNSADFIDAVEAHPDKTYFVSIPCTTMCWSKRPVTREKTYKYAGEIRSKQEVGTREKKPLSVETIAQNVDNYFWYRRTVSEGTKGPIAYEFTRRQVVIAKDGLPWKQVWLIVKRTVGDEPSYSYYISNADKNTPLKTFVWLSGIRWAIEQCFEETKSELGMDHYEVRKLPGWNHHMITCMLAHFFLWHLKIRLGGKSTSNYFVAA